MACLEKLVSSPKFLLTKKEVTEEEFISMQNNTNQVKIQESKSERLFSFASNNNGNGNSNIDYNRINIISPISKNKINQSDNFSEKPNKEHKPKSFLNAQHINRTQNESHQFHLNNYINDYDEFYIEDRNEDKERNLEGKMKDKIEQQVKRDLYESQYSKVIEKIRNEKYDSIVNELILRQEKEIKHIKSKFESATKQKLIEIEKQLTTQYKKDNEKVKREIVKQKENEFKTFYNDKLYSMKIKAKNSLVEKYNVMHKELNKELEDIKDLYKQVTGKECFFNNKSNSISNSKTNTNIEKGFDIRKERINKNDAQDINEFMSICNKSQIKSHHKHLNNNSNSNTNQMNKIPESQLNKSSSKTIISTRNLSNIIRNNDITQIQSNNSRSINLAELNNKLKCLSPRSNSCKIIKTKNNIEEYYNFPLKR